MSTDAAGAATSDAERNALAAGQTVSLGSEVSSGLVTGDDLRVDPPALVVQALEWDSGFRGSGLQIGDRIVAVDSIPVARPATVEEAQRTVFKMVGQYGEYQSWAEAGRNDGSPVTLTVRRKHLPRGWETLEISGTLRAQRAWRSADNRPLIGPGGPEEMEHDGFADSWSSWLEKGVGAWTRSMTYYRAGMRVSAADVDVEGSTAQVALLGEKYPGPFAEAMAADWAAVQQVIAGEVYPLALDALAYRELGEQKVQGISEAGTAARAVFLEEHAAELIPPFPSIDPILDDRSGVMGKLVELPQVTSRQWINQGDHTAFVFTQGDDCYVAEVTGPTEQMVRTQRRYEKLVTPNLSSYYDVIARILPDPTIVIVDERALFALKVEPVAASVGYALFVDLSTGAESPPFAGEEALHRQDVTAPGADASPEAVLGTMFEALKVGDLELWTSLFTDWTFFVSDDGRPVLSAWGPSNLDADWEFARRMILGEVVDVRVRWTDDPITLFSADAFENAPTIEQVTIEVDHLRLEPDGSGRSYSAVGLTRLWAVQRLNGGPWRIATNAGI